MPALLQHIVNAAPPVSGAARKFALEQMPEGLAQTLWHGGALGQARHAVVDTGFAALNAQLPGGGWPCNAVTEILQPQPCLCEWQLLAPALAAQVSGGGQVVLVGPPRRPYAPGLAQLGIGEKHLVWIAADKPAERLWSTEQLVKSNPGGGAILAWLPQVRSDQLRRLQVHAQSCDCPVFLFRPEAAQWDASPAPLRLLATLTQGWELRIHILKRRGTPLDGPMVLPSVPGMLAQVLPPRLMHPAEHLPNPETAHVLGRTDRTRRPQYAAAW